MRGSLNMSVEHARKIILACCALHNYLRTEATATYTPPGFADTVYPNGQIEDGLWRQENPMRQIQPPYRGYTTAASSVRELFVDYFNDAGAVNWQQREINRTETN